MARLFLDERNLRDAGVSEQNLRTLRVLTAFVESQVAISEAQGAIDAAEADISTLTTAVNANTATNTAQNGRLDTIESDYLQKDSAAAPSFTGQTITDPPTQAEVQNIDDALAALIAALQSGDVLS